MSLQPGMHLGRYEIGSLLGEGGFANVYKGYQREYDRTVAIKVLHEWLAKDTRIVSRFREEAIKTFNLQHPNIVRVLDFQQDRGYYFIVMELVNGQSLRQLINARDAVDIAHDEDIVATRMHEIDNAKTQLHRLSSSYQELDLGILSSIFRDVCNALSYAHGEGIIHRDVKPDNILVSRDGRALLVDFGIAKAQDEALHLTSTGARIGSALYMAPEQIRVADQQDVDYRADIYALGITLYEVLTGTPPFVADNAKRIWEMQLNASPVPPSHLKPDLPEQLNEVVLKCLEKEPKNRYQKATDVAQALSADIVPKPITSLFGITPPPDRNKHEKEESKLVCPVCGYDFHSIESQVTCPACGHQFPIPKGKQAFAERESRAAAFLRNLGLSTRLSLDVKAYEYDKSIKTPLQTSFKHTLESAAATFADGAVILPEEQLVDPSQYTKASAAMFAGAALLKSQVLDGFVVSREARRYRRQSAHKAKALAYAAIGKYYTALAASYEQHEKIVQAYEQSTIWYQKAQEQAKQVDKERDLLTSRFEAAEMLIKLILDFPLTGQDQLAEQVVHVLSNLPVDYWGVGADREKAESYRGLYAAKLEAIEKAKKGIAVAQSNTFDFWKEWHVSDKGSLLAPFRVRLNRLFARQLPSLLRHDVDVHLTLWIGILLLWLLARTVFPVNALIRTAHVLAFLSLPHFLSPAIGLTRTALTGLLILLPWITGYWGGYGRVRPSVRHFSQIDLILSLVAGLTLLPWLGLWLYGALLVGLGFLAGRYLDEKRAFKRGGKVGMVIGGALLVLFLLYLVLYAAPLTLVVVAFIGLVGWLSGDYVCRLDVTWDTLTIINNDLSLLERESELLAARLLRSVRRDKFVNVGELKNSVEAFQGELAKTIVSKHMSRNYDGFTTRLKEGPWFSLHRLKQVALRWIQNRKKRVSTKEANKQERREEGREV